MFFTTYRYSNKLIRICSLLASLAVAGSLPAQSTKSADLQLVLTHVQFSAEKSTIQSEAARELDEVARLLQKTPAVTLAIGAHTDASGSASYNLRLSQRRAQAVAAYLIKKGVAQKRLRATGYGETRPLNRCRRGVRCTEAEKRQNRRIELLVHGLPADSTLRDQWLVLGGIRPASFRPPATDSDKPVPVPVFTSSANKDVPTAPASKPALAGLSRDYFPELTAAGKTHIPQPLPATFAGYTIEIVCSEQPLAASHPALRKFEPIMLRQEAGGPYCYYIGAYHTLPEAQQFFRNAILPGFPEAQVVAFFNYEKRYLTN